MIPRNYNEIILRSAEGEGGSGGGAEGGDASTVDRLNQRLDQVTTILTGLMQERKQEKVQTTISDQERQITRDIEAAEAEVTAIEKKVADAYDNGDGAQIAKANREMAEAIAKREGAKATKREFDRLKAAAEKRSGGTEGAANLDTTNLTKWKQKHASWYGVDDDMTQAAHGIDRQIRAAGVIPVGSPEYFEAIDRQMRQKYPDRMARTPDTEGGRGASGGDTRRSNRIPASVAEGYRRMGINIDDPKVAERMVKAREVAVQKGFLPAEPVTGNVRQR